MPPSEAPARPVIFGEVLFDRFPDGSEVLGGAPFNVAWHLQGFGERPLFISRVGDDAAGERVRAAMAAWGMDPAGLQTDATHTTGAVEITFSGSEHRFEILPDQAYDHIDAEALPKAIHPAFVYHGTLALRQADARAALATLLERTRARVFLDVNLRAPWWSADAVLRLARAATWLKLNEDEAAELGNGPAAPEPRAHALLERLGLEQLLLTRGSAGAVALTASGQREAVVPAGAPRVVDTVGAGDAFAAVYLLGLLRGWGLAETLRRAQAFASDIVGVRGATVADPAFYRAHLDAWRNTP